MINPAGHRVMVEAEVPDGMTIDPDTGELVSKGGIRFSEEYAKKEMDTQVLGKVVGIGPTAFKGIGAIEKHTKIDSNTTIVEAIGEPWCKLGDKVFYARHVGLRVVDPDQPQRLFYLIHDKDVLGVVEVSNNE